MTDQGDPAAEARPVGPALDAAAKVYADTSAYEWGASYWSFREGWVAALEREQSREWTRCTGTGMVDEDTICSGCPECVDNIQRARELINDLIESANLCHGLEQSAKRDRDAAEARATEQQSLHDGLVAAAQTVVEIWPAVNEALKPVYSSAYIHGVTYNGPTLPIESLRSAVRALSGTQDGEVPTAERRSQ